MQASTGLAIFKNYSRRALLYYSRGSKLIYPWVPNGPAPSLIFSYSRKRLLFAVDFCSFFGLVFCVCVDEMARGNHVII
jgi:hypothetical protein